MTVAAYLPYLFLNLGILSTFRSTREPLDTLIATPTFQDLLASLAYITDAIEAKDPKGKESTKLGRARRKAYTRLWRGLREVSILYEKVVILADRVVPRRPTPDPACTARQICPGSQPLRLLDRPYHWRAVKTETKRCGEG